jgi:hypothetical protein
MPSSIFNGDSVKILKDKLKFKSGSKISYGNVDPTATLEDGEPGDLFIDVTVPRVWLKKDSGPSSEWYLMIEESELAIELSNYVLTSQLGAVSGVATLDAGQKLTASQIPAIAITDTFVVASQVAQTALTAEVGDVAVRTDQNKSYILVTSPASTFGNWQELLSPTDAVLSVFSRTGIVTAQSGDYNAGQITNTPSGNLAATDVQAALNELQSDVDGRATTTALTDHINDLTDAHLGTAIGNTPSGNLAATNVQAALNELQSDVDGRATTALGNLASVAINASLLPATDNTINIGSATKRYIDGYIQVLRDSAGVSALSVEAHALRDVSGAISVDFASTVQTSFNNKKLIEAGLGGNLTDVANKQLVENSKLNLIPDGDAEGAQIFTQYADSASRIPLDGFGGSPNVTRVITAINPLTGLNSFQLGKDAANRQGQGWSVPFTVPTSLKAKVLQIDFDYIVSSGTFAAGSATTDSDVIVYIYDVTNSQLIEPSNIKLLSNSSTISDKFIANFQTSATGTSYRLILHCATTSAVAYGLNVDNVSIKPCNYVYGTPLTNSQTYTPTIQNNTGGMTNYTATGRWAQAGENMVINGGITFSGTSAAFGKIYVNLPS